MSAVDWASDPNDRRSTSGVCVYYGSNLVSWLSKKQQVVSRSSIEAEYRSLVVAVSEILWLQCLLKELHVPQCPETPMIHCDNMLCYFLPIQFSIIE